MGEGPVSGRGQPRVRGDRGRSGGGLRRRTVGAARALSSRWLWTAALTALIVARGGENAHAQLPLPLPNPLSPIGGALGAGAADVGVQAFEAIIEHLFAPVARFINV